MISFCVFYIFNVYILFRSKSEAIIWSFVNPNIFCQYSIFSWDNFKYPLLYAGFV